MTGEGGGMASMFPELEGPVGSPRPDRSPSGVAWRHVRGLLFPCDVCFGLVVVSGRIRAVLPRGSWRRTDPAGVVSFLCGPHADEARRVDGLPPVHIKARAQAPRRGRR